MTDNQNRQTDDIERVKDFLRRYRYGFKMLTMNRYENDYFGGNDFWDGIKCADDEAYVKAKMFEIKRFVTSLPPDDRKLFLYYHYIHGETVEKCGELLGISRRSAFRLKRRALEYAALKYKRYIDNSEINRVISRE